jgi:hypothetical protein
VTGNDMVFAYQHSLPEEHYNQLCALPEVIARYSTGANQTDLLRNIRRDIAECPTDPVTGHRLLELESNDQKAVLAMLDWAAHRSGDARFAWLANDLREGTEASDAKMDDQSLFN